MLSPEIIIIILQSISIIFLIGYKYGNIATKLKGIEKTIDELTTAFRNHISNHNL
jgi:hypothetical protein